jgi:hypothetical protein
MISKKLSKGQMPLSRRSSKSMVALLLGLLVLSAFYACSRSVKPKSDSLSIELGGRTFTRYIDLLRTETYEGEKVVILADFIDSAIISYPTAYAYRIFGSDGYYPAMKGVPDNVWTQLQKGYLKLGDRGVVFDSSLHLPRKYNVTDVASLELLRKVDTIIKGDPGSGFCLIGGMNLATYEDSVDNFYSGRTAIKLTDFVETVTSTPEDFAYRFISANGGEKSFSWSQVQTGWWLVDLDVTKFNPDLGPDSRIPYLQIIELIPNSK